MWCSQGDDVAAGGIEDDVVRLLVLYMEELQDC